MQRLAGKVSMITGGTAGIGRATAVRFAEEAAIVVITGRNRAEADKTLELVHRAGATGWFLEQDVTVEAGWVEVTRAVVGRFGRLDVLVNNAGAFFVKPLADTSLEDFRGLWRINVEAVFLGTKHAMALMARNETGGSIVTVASLAGLVGLDQCSAYCGSKAAAIEFSRAAAVEGAALARPVRVNAVAPGPVWTDMIARQYGDTAAMRNYFSEDQPLKILGLPADVADGVLYLASDESRYVTGMALTIDGGRGAD
jgi:NAD(P)-dependent dehydrogenase (short-subunit alcohol dehydrogenase family)